MAEPRVTVGDMLQALFLAAGHKATLEDQQMLALSLIDWAVQEADQIGPSIDDRAYGALTRAARKG